MNDQHLINRLSALPDPTAPVHVDLDTVITRGKLRRRRRWEVAAATAATVAVTAGMIVLAGSLHRPQPPTGPGQWQAHPPGMPDLQLFDIEAISDSDVWAVGSVRGGSSSSNVAVHWDGQRWQRFDLSSMLSVGAVASDDVWAVGNRESNGVATPVATHWDGRTWKEVPVPTDRPGVRLYEVAGAASDDVWAIGSTDVSDPQGDHPLILHWDGRHWGAVPTPAIPNAHHMDLSAISVRAADDVWAVGKSDAGPGELPFAVHWDGKQWSHSPMTTENGYMYDVVALAPDDVWAVGTQTFFHWDGSGWTAVPGPNPGHDFYSAIASDGTGGLIAVGTKRCVQCLKPDPNDGFVAVARWNGSVWTELPGPPAGPGSSRLGGLSTTRRTGTVWAIGDTIRYPPSSPANVPPGPNSPASMVITPLVAAISFRK